MVDMPDRIFAEHDEDTNEKRWFSIKGMGTEYTRSDLVAELEAENERLNEGWDHTSKMLGVANARAYEAEKSLTEALASTGAVKVKALEWAFGETKPSPDLSVWIAAAPGTNETYAVWHSTNPDAVAPYSVPKIHNGFYNSLDAAKAAAQADYERRILSGIASHQRATNTVDAHETGKVRDKQATPPAPKVTRAQAELIRRIVLPMVGERSREAGDAWDNAYHVLDVLTAAQEAGHD